MQYMLLIYSDASREPAYGSPEFGPMMARYLTLTEQMQRDGVFVAGDPLQPPATATSLRIVGGKVETMDGPFAETREHLGGYYLIAVPDLDAALRYAALIPAAEYGTVEVRPVVDMG